MYCHTTITSFQKLSGSLNAQGAFWLHTIFICLYLRIKGKKISETEFQKYQNLIIIHKRVEDGFQWNFKFPVHTKAQKILLFVIKISTFYYNCYVPLFFSLICETYGWVNFVFFNSHQILICVELKDNHHTFQLWSLEKNMFFFFQQKKLWMWISF